MDPSGDRENPVYDVFAIISRSGRAFANK